MMQKLLIASDSHLHTNKDGCGPHWTAKPYFTLRSLLKNAKKINPELLLFNGDVTEFGDEAAYQNLCSLLEEVDWSSRVYALPGNHDNFANLARYLNYSWQIDLQNWSIYCLNSTVEGEHYGFIKHQDLQKLQNDLQINQNKHILICLHHHIVDVNIPSMSNYNNRNSQELLSILEKFPNVKGIVTGHAHVGLNVDHKHIKIFCAPSTVKNLQQGVEQFLESDEPAALVCLNLSDDGSLTSEYIY